MHLGIASPLDLAVLSELLSIRIHESCTTDVPYISNLVFGIAGRIDRVSVYTYSFDVDSIKVYNSGNISVYILPHRRRPRDVALSFWKRERKFLVSAIDGSRPDLVHAHWTYEYALGALSSDVPVLVTAHDTPWDVFAHRRDLFGLIRLALAYRVSCKLRGLTAVSPYTARHWKRYMAYRRKEIDVIANGVRAPREGSNKVSIGRDLQEYVIASISAGWGEGKNTKTLIKAFQLFRQEHPDAKLLLFGYGHGVGEEAESWSRSRGLSEGIEFAGQVPHAQLIERLRTSVDIYVHPSRFEQCSLAIIEAMSLGLPVIGGQDSGGVPWQLGDGKYGLMVDIEFPNEICNGMRRILTNPEEYREWSRRASEGYKHGFSLTGVIEKYIKVYHREINQGI